MDFTAKQIATFINGEIIGDENAKVCTFAKIEEGTPGALSFLSNPKYTNYIYETQSSIVLVNRDFVPEQPVKATLIKTDNAYESLAKLLTLYESSKPKRTGVSELAYIAESAVIGKEVYIAPFVYVGEHAVVGDRTVLHPHVTIEENAKIGADCELYPRVTVYHDCKVGDRCILHAGSVVGADGFGFAPGKDGYEKIPQIGIAVLEDDVEIGANTCIDRSTMGATIVGKGTKLDNLIQVAHNVVIGKNTVMASQTGIAGSTKVGDWCMIGGQTGISGHIKIGNGVKVGGHSAISNDVQDGKAVMGYPAFEHVGFARSSVLFKKMPEMAQQLYRMEKEIEALKKIIEKQ